MSKTFACGAKSFAVLVAVSAALLLAEQKARAGSPYDDSAYNELSVGYDYAADEYYYGNDYTGSADCAEYYAYYAQYYADLAYTYDDQYYWYEAYECGYEGYLYAADSYDATGDDYAYYAMVYLYYGFNDAYDAYVYYQ